jgi:hypothetical protein
VNICVNRMAKRGGGGWRDGLMCSQYRLSANFVSAVMLRKSRLKSGNACYHSDRISSSSLLSKNVKMKIYKAIILAVVLYGCENW